MNTKTTERNFAPVSIQFHASRNPASCTSRLLFSSSSCFFKLSISWQTNQAFNISVRMPLRGCAAAPAWNQAHPSPWKTQMTHSQVLWIFFAPRLLNAMCPASNLPNLLQAPVSMPASWVSNFKRYNMLWKSLELGQFQIELGHCLQLCPCRPVDGSQGRGYLSLPMK